MFTRPRSWPARGSRPERTSRYLARSFGTTTKELLAAGGTADRHRRLHPRRDGGDEGVLESRSGTCSRAHVPRWCSRNAAHIKAHRPPQARTCATPGGSRISSRPRVDPRASQSPTQAIQELRALTRTRKQFVEEKTRQIQRIQKTLEDASAIKLDGVISDNVGTSGESDAGGADRGRDGSLTSSPRWLTRGSAPATTSLPKRCEAEVIQEPPLLAQGAPRAGQAHIEDAIDAIDHEVEAALEPFREHIKRLRTIPGINTRSWPPSSWRRSAPGLTMSRFPTAQHLVSWARLCPRNDESAGKRQSMTAVRKGSAWLKPVLVQIVLSPRSRKKPHNYLRAKYLPDQGAPRAEQGAHRHRRRHPDPRCTSCSVDKVPFRRPGPRLLRQGGRLPRRSTRLVQRLNALGL